MGQKVHPLGFRVGITKKHQSQWFARFQKYGYAQSVVEDHMLRKNLLNLFSNLQVDPAQASKPSKKGTKPGVPKITQIKIERGLIPYEIGIQIHADDCLGLTKAIDNLKINKDLVSNLQKTRKYLFKTATQLKNVDESTYNYLPQRGPSLRLGINTNNPEGVTAGSGSLYPDQNVSDKNLESSTKKKRKFKIKPLKSVKKGNKFGSFKKKKKLSKITFMRLKAIKKRFKKRQYIKKRYRQLIAKGLVIRKQGNLITRKVAIKKNAKNQKASVNLSQRGYPRGVTALGLGINTNKVQGRSSLLRDTRGNTNLNTNALQKNETNQQTNTLTIKKGKYTLKKMNSFTNRMYKKFASLFLTKLNKQFLLRLKNIMKDLNSFPYGEQAAIEKSPALNPTYAPLGYNKKWYSAKSYTLTNHLKTKFNLKTLGSYQIEKLTKLIDILERKSLIKMEALRKDYVTFGSLSKTRAFGYYQIITFLKQLKELVNKIKKQNIKTNKASNSSLLLTNPVGVPKGPFTTFGYKYKQAQYGNSLFKEKIRAVIRAKSKQKKFITHQLISSFKTIADNNQAMTNECRKIKLISYLKDVVTKHRTENIFYYLATIADARKNLKNLKTYIKQHANFLFGINTENHQENANVLMQKVTKALSQSLNQDQVTEGSTYLLQKAFLNFINDQRKMYKANLSLTPKISIKFFSVKTTDILEKASVVADSIVDALEKRKAFRGVIKKAKEDLMRRTRVKGVKIQVAGRLNGAEIARSEWVRAGRVPLQTLRANIDYSYRTASTIYGIIGVKVWIFKGYSKIN